MLEGKSGISPIIKFDVSDYKTPYGSIVNDSDMTNALTALNMKPGERVVDMAVLAAHQALSQAGMFPQKDKPQYTAVIFGTGTGSSHAIYSTYMGFAEKGIRGVRPTAIPRCMANSISSNISLRFKLTGPNYVMISACASSTLAIGNAFRMISDGYIDHALCGGSDATFEPVAFAAWNNLGVMSKSPNHDKACRPFDINRDGCVIGEGAGALLLESLESAEKRKATILGEIRGFGESSDASHITTPSPEGQATAIRMALNCAEIRTDEVGFINAHGTATKANDTCESQSIRLALGDATDNIPVASNKSFFGHMLGASGSVETIVTIMGLANGKVPPNRNLDNPDPECTLNLVGSEPMSISSPVAMKNSFGFGGNNAVLVMRKY